MVDDARIFEPAPKQIGRYALGRAIAAGGMGTLHLGRLVGSAGFARTVAIKRLHPHLCVPSFVESFADEARLAARVRHPNVVPTLDVVSSEGELLIVMEYVDGESLAALTAATPERRVPLPIAVAIMSETLHGLHAAHEAKSESGQPLGIVHRDVSPQNVLVGADGVARLADFGIARATNRSANTGPNDVKGKLAYMAPEQLRGEAVTRKADIFAAGVVLWELLTGTRLFASDSAGGTIEKILVGWVAPPSSVARDLPVALDEIALRALDPDPDNRFETARDMAVALEDALGRALGREVAAWVESTAADALAKRRAIVAAEERGAGEVTPTDPHGPTALPVDHARSSPPLPIELEPTVTAFSTPSREPAGGGVHRAAPPRRGRLAEKAALVVFAMAATVTVFFGVRRDDGDGTRPTAAVELTELAAAPPAIEAPPPSIPVVAAPVAPPAPEPSPIASASAARPPQVAATRPARRPAKARHAAPARSPCVASLDPVTQKKVYHGDCD